MILVRTTTLDDETIAFGRSLGAAAGQPAAFVVDERQGPVPAAQPVERISLTDAACRALGLFCPSDFAWRCGDYGLYLARAKHPHAAHFWMVENDVRFAGGGMEAFFAFFDAQDADLLAGHLQPADSEWYWTHHASSRDSEAYRCFFPVTRFSARALDVLLAKRRAHSRRLARRAIWPNDEAFVATTLKAAGLTCRDFNDFGRTFYDAETFSFRNVFKGEDFRAAPDGLRMYHPVLFGEAYARKLEKLHAPRNLDTRTKRRTRRVLSEINARTRW